MTNKSKKILAEALELPPIERAALVEALLSSFDFPALKEIDQLWSKEAEERIEAYERGELRVSPAKDVFERIDRSQKK
jgi:putative addiction module component (TIGR02574 family)